MAGENNRERVAQGPEIVLPDDPLVRSKLEAKLGEYKQRLEKLESDRNFLLVPEQYEEKICGTIYKIAVTETLLETGRVDTYALSRKLAAERPDFFSDRFDNACGVIKDYIERGGAGVIGGTF